MHNPIRNAALASAFSTALFAFPVFSATTASPLDLTMVVTAKRFPEAAAAAIANISVITQAEIENSPARSIPDLLKATAGVDIRPLYGVMGIDAVVDIRGSGEAAGNNTLILVDGQRLNPVDMGSVKWETVPLSAIKQIEIVRGSGSVLYGDRASGGVINIITDKSDKARASVRAERGSFAYTALDAFVSGGNDGWRGQVFAHDASTDGYRQNSDARQTSAGGRLARFWREGEVFLDLSGYRQQYGLPGTLSRAQFDNDARLSTVPNYRMARDGLRLRPGGSLKLGGDLTFDIDGSISDDLLKARNSDWFYRSESRVKASALSPRLKWTHGLEGAQSSETIFGIDIYDGKATGDNLDFASGTRQNRQIGQQQGQGVYLQNLTLWKNHADTLVAIRQQHFEQKVSDASANLQGRSSDHLQAWELGLGYRFAEAWRAYVKAARSFRLPNTDELFAYDPATYQVLFNGALRPQTGHLTEVGLSWTQGNFRQQVSWFEQTNRNEIGFIADYGRNANLDPTRRRGFEWEGRWYLADAWSVRGSLSSTRAIFSAGAYSGKDIPLVPQHRETLGVEWAGGRAGTHNLVLVGVGGRRFGGDFSNVWRAMDAYNTLDYQAQWSIKPCTLIFRVANLTDRKYSATGFSSAFNSGTYYPADPRSYSLALRAEFF